MVGVVLIVAVVGVGRVVVSGGDVVIGVDVVDVDVVVAVTNGLRSLSLLILPILQ